MPDDLMPDAIGRADAAPRGDSVSPRLTTTSKTAGAFSDIGPGGSLGPRHETNR